MSDTWVDFYDATAGRAPRELFIRALDLRAADGDGGGDALDIGCGDGTETPALLDSGWNVTAIDGEADGISRLTARVPGDAGARLQTQVASFGEMDLPKVDLVYAGLSLFFCAPDAFPAMWERVRDAIRPRGFFAGHLLGDRDTWAVDEGITAHTAPEVRALFSGMTIEYFNELEHDRPAVSGPKHWHNYEIIARA